MLAPSQSRRAPCNATCSSMTCRSRVAWSRTKRPSLWRIGWIVRAATATQSCNSLRGLTGRLDKPHPPSFGSNYVERIVTTEVDCGFDLVAALVVPVTRDSSAVTA